VQLAEHFDCRSGWNEAAASPELTGWLAGWLAGWKRIIKKNM
jgi:hypothetical protein